MIPTPKLCYNICHLRIVSAVGDYQLLSSWTLPKFYARLEMMYEVPKIFGRSKVQESNQWTLWEIPNNKTTVSEKGSF